MPDYPHIHLRKLGRVSNEFRGKGRGSTKNPSAVADRQGHATELRRQLSSTLKAIAEVTALQKSAGVERKRRGLPLTSVARPGEDIRVGTLKLNSPGLQLLSFNRNAERQVANFFVSKSNVIGLQKLLDKYEAYEDGDRPRRFNLFESVAEFRVAGIADLWTDDIEKLPPEGTVAQWEIWVRLDAEGLFKRHVERLGLLAIGKPTVFVDTAVFNIEATADNIERLIRGTAAVVELRSASSFVADYLDFDPEERTAALSAVMALMSPPPSDSPLTTMLDTGVNHANPLVGVGLAPADCHTIDDSWITTDHNGHGTNMAGIALYGDLEAKITAAVPVPLYTNLESVVITGPAGGKNVPAHEALDRAIRLVANDDRRRILCLAQTAPNDFSDGRQSALSGVVDRIAWNDGVNSRLICVAAGNVPANIDKRYPIGPYDMRNAEHRLESPAQAVNALTVGGATHKCSSDWESVAPQGDLCPSSRTSQNWDIHYAYKPDIVMEAGNHEVDIDPLYSAPTKNSLLLTAGRNYPTHPFGWTGETSAATAKAAGLATRLQAQYPEFRAETLRALMVHNAEWTPAMLARETELRKLGLSRSDALDTLLRCYGWGIPDEERLFRSAGNALTLIVEDDLDPYKKTDKGISLKEMKYFKLPWPVQDLKNLNQEEVELRCTLSYFAEPDPHAASRSRWDRYPSHRLRFDVKRFGDDDLTAQQRVNLYASDEDVEDLDDSYYLGGSVPSEKGWVLGDQKRRRGTIHHDIWTGKAFELAERDAISVYPVRGWWGDRKTLDYFERSARFSLVVSIRTKSTDVDLYAATKVNVAAKNLVAAPTMIMI